MGVMCSETCGTLGYVCPVYVKTGRVTEGSEVYSFGVVLYELLLNLPPAERIYGKVRFPLFEAIQTNSNDVVRPCIELADMWAKWPSAVVSDLARLASACIDAENAQRPSFTAICRALREIQGTH